jgi:acyl carrier protein
MAHQITEQTAKAFIADRLASLLSANASDIDPAVEFDRFGLDSARAVELTADISDWTGEELDPTVLYDHPTINALSKHLVGLMRVDTEADAGAEELSKVST